MDKKVLLQSLLKVNLIITVPIVFCLLEVSIYKYLGPLALITEVVVALMGVLWANTYNTMLYDKNHPDGDFNY